MQKRTLGGLGKNEPKRTQTNPIWSEAKMGVNIFFTRNYKNICGVEPRKTNPKQTQSSLCGAKLALSAVERVEWIQFPKSQETNANLFTEKEL
jgi:hypothetical protein